MRSLKPEKALNLVFVGGDVGGVRALGPVADLCIAAGHRVRVIGHGAFKKEWHREDHPLEVAPSDSAETEVALRNWVTDCLIFSSSVADIYALSMARVARKLRIPTVYVLDHWADCTRRMSTDNRAVFHPNRYTVLDTFSYDQVKNAGFAESSIRVTGHPGLAGLRTLPRRKGGSRDERPCVAFVGEPILQDQGNDPSRLQFRGFTEYDVIEIFADAVKMIGVELQILLLPHPRQKPNDLLAAWTKAGKGLDAQLMDVPLARTILGQVDGLVGISSMLLYEGWLCGHPILSLQPNRRVAPLAFLEGRGGFEVVLQADEAFERTIEWYSHLKSENKTHLAEAVAEREKHESAPHAVLAVINECAGEGSIN